MKSAPHISCEIEAEDHSDFFTAGEQKAVKKLGGLLYVAAAALIGSFLVYLLSSYNTFSVLVMHYDTPGILENIILFEGIVSLFMLLLCCYTLVLFFRKKTETPVYYSVFLSLHVLYIITDILLSHYLCHIKLEMNHYFLLFRALIYVCIWVPYFIFSDRVKQTFVR